MDIPHAFQIPAYGLFADAVLGRKLSQRLFAIDIIADNLGFITPYTAIKTTAAVFTFISLGTASQTVPDHILRPAEKAFFLTISIIISAKIVKSADYTQSITPNVQPALFCRIGVLQKSLKLS